MEGLASQSVRAGPIIVIGDFFFGLDMWHVFFCTSTFVAQVENAGLQSTNACSRRGERCTTTREIYRKMHISWFFMYVERKRVSKESMDALLDTQAYFYSFLQKKASMK